MVPFATIPVLPINLPALIAASASAGFITLRPKSTMLPNARIPRDPFAACLIALRVPCSAASPVICLANVFATDGLSMILLI